MRKGEEKRGEEKKEEEREKEGGQEHVCLLLCHSIILFMLISLPDHIYMCVLFLHTHVTCIYARGTCCSLSSSLFSHTPACIICTPLSYLHSGSSNIYISNEN